MKRSDCLVIAATTAFCVAVFVIATGPSGGFVKALSHPATAAWVQAIGSIGAIGVAIWVANDAANRNRHTALEMRNREASTRLEIAHHIANEAKLLVGMAAKSIRGELNISLGEGDFQSVRDAIDALPFAELTHGRVVVELMTIRRLLGPIEKLCEANNLVGLAMTKSDQKSMKDELARREAAFDRTFVKMEQAVRDALDRLNRSHDEGSPR